MDKINRELHKLRRRITRVAWCLRKNVRSLVSYMPLASSCAAVKGKRLTRAVLSLVSEHSDTSITAPGSCPHRSAPLPSAATSSPPRVQQQKLTKADDERTHNTNHDGLLSAPVIFHTTSPPRCKTRAARGLSTELTKYEASDEAVHHNRPRR